MVLLCHSSECECSSVTSLFCLEGLLPNFTFLVVRRIFTSSVVLLCNRCMRDVLLFQEHFQAARANFILTRSSKDRAHSLTSTLNKPCLAVLPSCYLDVSACIRIWMPLLDSMSLTRHYNSSLFSREKTQSIFMNQVRFASPYS